MVMVGGEDDLRWRRREKKMGREGLAGPTKFVGGAEEPHHVRRKGGWANPGMEERQDGRTKSWEEKRISHPTILQRVKGFHLPGDK